MSLHEIDLSFLPWKQIKEKLFDLSYTPQQIQAELNNLYADAFDRQALYKTQTIIYDVLTQTSLNDQHRDLEKDYGEMNDDNGVSNSLHYRIRELWKRFLIIRENQEALMKREVIDAFLLLCATIMERTIRRRIQFVQDVWDEQTIQS